MNDEIALGIVLFCFLFVLAAIVSIALGALEDE